LWSNDGITWAPGQRSGGNLMLAASGVRGDVADTAHSMVIQRPERRQITQENAAEVYTKLGGA
jgi:hypothetical protein